jgi:hemoglobin
MTVPQPCSEDEIRRVVTDFCESVRADPLLGPFFAAHGGDPSRHVAKMIDFWSAALLGTARYCDKPLLAHNPMPGLTVELFSRWLSLFRRSAEAFASPDCRVRANAIAHQIAESLWWGYQQRHALADWPAPPSRSVAVSAC